MGRVHMDNGGKPDRFQAIACYYEFLEQRTSKNNFLLKRLIQPGQQPNHAKSAKAGQSSTAAVPFQWIHERHLSVSLDVAELRSAHEEICGISAHCSPPKENSKGSLPQMLICASLLDSRNPSMEPVEGSKEPEPRLRCVSLSPILYFPSCLDEDKPASSVAKPSAPKKDITLSFAKDLISSNVQGPFYAAVYFFPASSAIDKTKSLDSKTVKRFLVSLNPTPAPRREGKIPFHVCPLYQAVELRLEVHAALRRTLRHPSRVAVVPIGFYQADSLPEGSEKAVSYRKCWAVSGQNAQAPNKSKRNTAQQPTVWASHGGVYSVELERPCKTSDKEQIVEVSPVSKRKLSISALPKKLHVQIAWKMGKPVKIPVKKRKAKKQSNKGTAAGDQPHERYLNYHIMPSGSKPKSRKRGGTPPAAQYVVTAKGRHCLWCGFYRFNSDADLVMHLNCYHDLLHYTLSKPEKTSVWAYPGADIHAYEAPLVKMGEWTPINPFIYKRMKARKHIPEVVPELIKSPSKKTAIGEMKASQTQKRKLSESERDSPPLKKSAHQVRDVYKSGEDSPKERQAPSNSLKKDKPVKQKRCASTGEKRRKDSVQGLRNELKAVVPAQKLATAAQQEQIAQVDVECTGVEPDLYIARPALKEESPCGKKESLQPTVQKEPCANGEASQDIIEGDTVAGGETSRDPIEGDKSEERRLPDKDDWMAEFSQLLVNEPPKPKSHKKKEAVNIDQVLVGESMGESADATKALTQEPDVVQERRKRIRKTVAKQPGPPAPSKPLKLTTAQSTILQQMQQEGQQPARQYYHARTCQPIRPEELDHDSDDDTNDSWNITLSEKLLDEFEDVSAEERNFMKLWNRHIHSQTVYADSYVPFCCEIFARRFANIIVEKNMRNSFLLHLINLWDFSLLSVKHVINCLQIVDKVAAAQKHADAKIKTPDACGN